MVLTLILAASLRFDTSESTPFGPKGQPPIRSVAKGQGTVPPIQRPPNRPPLQTIPPPVQKGQGRLLPGLKNLQPELWGWADLHAHPANHLGYGSDANGDGGIFWGKPGLALGSNPLTDMPFCPVDSHTGFDADFVRKGTRQAIIGQLEGLTGCLHGTKGQPSFADWPQAQSLLHQQMHISAIKRAYDGGQRLMIASVADNQMLSNLWSKVGYNGVQSVVPPVDPTFDIQSAKRQIQYIRNMALSNPSWLKIVRSAAEARATIAANKMALIIGVEMDKLNLAQIQDLVTNWDVRSVIPVHVADNDFGGTALYVDLFNSANNYLNGSFFKVLFDPLLRFRLGKPGVLKGSQLGSIVPEPISQLDFQRLGYEKLVNGIDRRTEGHRNAKGLNKPGFQALMKLGLLLDLAHMSEASIDDALTLAHSYQYPLMDSHTGMRDVNEKSFSERELKRSDVRRIAADGGVIGMGTEGKTIEQPLININRPLVVRFSKFSNVWTSPMTLGSIPNASLCGFRLTLGSAGYGLRGGAENVHAEIKLRGGALLQFPLLNKNLSLYQGRTYTFPLATPVLNFNQLESLTLRTTFAGGIDSGLWDVNQIKLTAVITTHEPIAAFARELTELLTEMGGRGIALGTDINGYAPQVPFCLDAVPYPLNVASRFGPLPAGFTPLALPKSTLGTRTYDFKSDGIAHYGMLPDFLQAISARPEGAPLLQALYRSADAVVKMWEKVEAAKSKVP